jgi:glycosyltransferase involved in cell wall biosynthesis
VTDRPVNGKPRIVFDGLNLSLRKGTGIATYARILTRLAREFGYDIGIVYSTPFTVAAEPLLREIAFFDEMGSLNQLATRLTPRRVLNYIIDQARYYFPVEPAPLTFTGAVIKEQFADFLPEQDRGFIARNLFKNAHAFYNRTGKFVRLSLATPPNIFHCTCPLPLCVPSACNIYTIHDVVPLRLPFTTMENKRRTYRILRKIAREADHIVTVSETSKRDIVELLNVNPDRITNTYQAVALPNKYIERPKASVANYLEGEFGLTLDSYLLFFGSVEPKKNVGRLVDAYFASGSKIPLVLVISPGWQNEAEMSLVAQHQASARARNGAGPSIRCLDHVSLSTLVNLIRGARAVVFPSLYEGFGLPVMEAMMLGTPVVTGRVGALAEIAGDAALFVDPYDVDDLARALRTISCDADLRRDLSERGLAQADKFSIDRYRERMRLLYASLS